MYKRYRLRLYNCVKFFTICLTLSQSELQEWFGGEQWERVKAGSLKYMLRAYFAVMENQKLE